MGFVAANMSYGATVGITLAMGVVMLALFVTAVYFLDKKGVLDKMTDKLSLAFAKATGKTKRHLSDTIQGGSEVSDLIDDMKKKNEDSSETEEK